MGARRGVKLAPARYGGDGYARRQSWRETIKHANRQLIDLAVERDNFAYFEQVTRSDTDGGRLIKTAGRRWYEHYVAAAIRRQTDPATDSHSLLRVLDEMAAKPEDALDFGGAPIDRFEIKKYRREIATLSRKVVHFANREVAHATKLGVDPKDRPTFEDLHSCVEAFESIVARYSGYLIGATLLKQDAPGQYIPVFLAGKRFETIAPVSAAEVFAFFGLAASPAST